MVSIDKLLNNADLVVRQTQALPDNAKNLIEKEYPALAMDIDSLKTPSRDLNPLDQKIADAFKTDFGFFSTKENPRIAQLLADTHMDLAAAQARATELNAAAEAAEKGLEQRTHDVARNILTAKKKVFATSEGKQVLMQAFNDALAKAHQEMPDFVNDAKKWSTVPELLHLDAIDSDLTNFCIQLKNGDGHGHGMNVMVNQAQEIAYLGDGKLGDVMKERVRQSGLSEFHQETYSKIAQAFEDGRLDEHMKTLENPQHVKGVVQKAAPATAKPVTQEIKAEATAAAETTAREGSKFLEKIPGGKWTAGVATAAVVAGAGWALYEHNRNKETPAQENGAKR
jgi:hypothetical protein